MFSTRYDAGTEMFGLTRRITTLEKGKPTPNINCDNLTVSKNMSLLYNITEEPNSLLFSDTTGKIVKKTLKTLITDTTEQTHITEGTDGTVSVNLPQNLASISSPSFTNMTLSGTLNVYSTVNSTNTLTGSLIVSGGVGIGGGINVNDTSSFSGYTTAITKEYDNNTTHIATDAFVYNAIHTQNTISASPIGFENQTDSTITYSPSTRILTISPTGDNFKVWISGVRYTYSDPISMSPHTDANGIYIYYFDNSGLHVTTTYPSYYTCAYCSIVYYYSSTIGFATEERHSCSMDPATHYELHNQIGTYRVSGLALGGYTLNPTTPTDADNQITLTSGIISDEELLSSIQALPAGEYNVNVLTGVNSDWYYLVKNTPFHYLTGGFIQYLKRIDNDWVLTELPNRRYVNYYVYVVAGITSQHQIFIKPGQQIYDTLAKAQIEIYSDLLTSSFVPPEMIPIYQITFYNNGNYTNAGKCRVAGVTYISGSSRVILSSGNVTNHANLAGLEFADTSVTWGHINDIAQSIYGIKTFANTSISTSYTTGSLIVSGGVGVSGNIYTHTITPSNLTMTQNITKIDSDILLSANIDTYLSTQRATKTYIDEHNHSWNIYDSKTQGTHGGSFTSGSWMARTLNTINGNTSDASVTLSSNRITITRGKYLLIGRTPAYKVSRHQCRLRDITNNLTVKCGSSSICDDTVNGYSDSHIHTYLSVSATTTYELQHICSTTKETDGLGTASNFETEIYSEIIITKIGVL